MRPPKPVGATPDSPGGVGAVAEQHEARGCACPCAAAKERSNAWRSAPCMVETRGQPAGTAAL